MCNRNIVALNRIKAIVDAYKEERIHITIGNDDFNDVTHTYDVSVIMGIISNYINDAFSNYEK
jgi:hypothetical protein